MVTSEHTLSTAEILDLFAQAVKVMDNDPETRWKLKTLNRVIEEIYDNPSEKATNYLIKEYQEHPGLQKIVDMGFDLTEKIAIDLSTIEQAAVVKQSSLITKKIMGKLKKAKSSSNTTLASTQASTQASHSSHESTAEQNAEQRT